MLKYISLKVNGEMYNIVLKDALARGVPISERVVQIMAEHFERTDLAYVPRLPQGRKPKLVKLAK